MSLKSAPSCDAHVGTYEYNRTGTTRLSQGRPITGRYEARMATGQTRMRMWEASAEFPPRKLRVLGLVGGGDDHGGQDDRVTCTTQIADSSQKPSLYDKNDDT